LVIERTRGLIQTVMWRSSGGLFRSPVLPSLLPATVALIGGAAELGRLEPITGDALAFLIWAQQGALDANGIREPLWTGILYPAVQLLGAHFLIARLLGLVGFVVLVVSFQAIGTQLFGRLPGVVAAVFLAASPWLIWESGRGLREEMAAGAVLVFALGVVRGWPAPVLAAGAAVLALLRWDSLLLTLPVLALLLFRNRPGIRQYAVVGLILVTILSPLLILNWIRHHDPLYHSNYHAVFYRNQEFAGRPGFPGKAEVASDSYAGTPTTWSAYIFRQHTPGELAMRYASGSELIPVWVMTSACFYPIAKPKISGQFVSIEDTPRTVLPLLPVAAGLIGAVLLSRRAWPIPVMLVISVLEYAPLAQLGVLEVRLVLIVLPLLALGCMESVRRLSMLLAPSMGAIAVAAGRHRSRE
jgi:hypothetical protein